MTTYRAIAALSLLALTTLFVSSGRAAPEIPHLAVLLGDELEKAEKVSGTRARIVAAALLSKKASEDEARELLVIGWCESNFTHAAERCDPDATPSGVGKLGELGIWQERAPGGTNSSLCAGRLPAQAKKAIEHWRDCRARSWGDDGSGSREFERVTACYMGRRADDPEVRRRMAILESMQGGR